jgi:DNA polymerase-3 subunit delta'
MFPFQERIARRFSNEDDADEVMPFTDLKNQKLAVAMLQRSLRAGRLAHAYLFIGGSASDREALARALAQALNCEKAGGGKYVEDGCGRCAACKKIEADTHPDVQLVRPESKSRRISVEKIREFEKTVHLTPREGRVKVGIIVDADRLGIASSNAFLKTLEEPPNNSALLLLTNDPQKLLTTITSRCLPVRLAASSEKLSSIQERALALFAAEKTLTSDSFVAARYRVLAQLNALLETLWQEKEAAVREAWEVEKWDCYDRKVKEQLEKELEAAVESEYLAAREEVLATLLAWHRDVLAMVEGADARILMFPHYEAVLKKQAANLSYEQAAANLAAVEEMRQHLEQNISESLALEAGLLRVKG